MLSKFAKVKGYLQYLLTFFAIHMQESENQKEKFFNYWVEEVAAKYRKKLQHISEDIGYSPASLSQVRKGDRPVPDEVFNRFLEKYNLLDDYRAYVQSGFATFSKKNLQLGIDIEVLQRLKALEEGMAELRRQMNIVQNKLLEKL
ncbi:MAG: hypothetical protein DWQ44_00095 [Bacteroidetes bacterium]|nr:MAG: hypothetical protein DWQ33_05045 [Bacteroidota bacterium]REK06030.1 MAG: hypothetical protein DWQ39_04185 [Bacteroidota bacterium]REK37088.1 MAG: hypothetical protein DWQ44_00095 [Bacteroidota bacterium]REK47519.1 MAG: hypothetical protein DWQ48_12350 [Bacteroidota bacterium]